MKLKRADIRPLRLAIAAASVLLLLGIACIVVSDQYLSQARIAREAAKLQRAEAQKRVEQVAEEEQEIRQNLISYKAMLDRGLGSEESRLDIIDGIAKIKNDRRLFEIRYAIEAQRPLDYAGMKPSGNLDFVTSRMKLDMMLLHEEDLLDFLDDLSSSGKALVAVRDCSISRIDRAAPITSVTPRLQSQCDIDLIVLRQVKRS